MNDTPEALNALEALVQTLEEQGFDMLPGLARAREVVAKARKPRAEPLLKERLFQFSVNRMAFATVSVRASDMDDAREKAMVEAMNMSEAAWSLDPEIEIDGVINSNGELQRIDT